MADIIVVIVDDRYAKAYRGVKYIFLGETAEAELFIFQDEQEFRRAYPNAPEFEMEDGEEVARWWLKPPARP